MDRKLPPQAQKVMDRYTVNFVRRLTKERAIQMFEEEFEMVPERAQLMFKMFDEDGSNTLNAWKYYHFFMSFGYDTNTYLDTYNKLEIPGTGTADVSGTWDFLKELKTLSGRCLKDEEMETCIKAVAGEERSIDLTKFISLISRIKLTRS